MDSSVENVENYTKKVSKTCKITHFPHFDKNKGICLTERLFTNWSNGKSAETANH